MPSGMLASTDRGASGASGTPFVLMRDVTNTEKAYAAACSDERRLDADGADQRAGERRPDDAHRVRAERVDGDGVRQVVRADDVVDHHLARGLVDRVGEALERRRCGYSIQTSITSVMMSSREQGGDDGAERRHRHQHRAAAEAVGDGAGERRDDDGRDAADEADGADLERRVGELEDEVALGGELHPLAQHGADVAEPEAPEVGDAERGERAVAVAPDAAASRSHRGALKRGGHRG